MKKTLVAELDFRVNVYDIDAMGIVSNIVYIRWFEDLRMAYLDANFPYKELMEEQISPIIMNTEAAYKEPVTIYDHPIGRCWMTAVGGSSWEMAFEISSGDRIHCTGIQKGCFYDVAKKRVTRMPARLANPFKDKV